MKGDEQRLILEKGILAPSADNLQPWKFKLGSDQIDLFLDPERVNNFCDAGYFVPYLSGGAVIENMRVTATHLGYQLRPSYFPRKSDPFWVATLYFSSTKQENHPHYPCLGTRTTNRKFYDPRRKIDPSIYSKLEAAVTSEKGFKLLWLKRESPPYPKLCRMIGTADQLRFENKQLLNDFITILRFTPSEVEKTKDGLDFRALEAGPASYWLFKLMSSGRRMKFVNALGMSLLLNFYAQLQMWTSQAAGLIISTSNGAMDYVLGGEVIEKIWHEMTREGLAVQPMEALPIFIIKLKLSDRPGVLGTAAADSAKYENMKWERLKHDFFDLFGISDQNGLILLFRLGYASAPSARSLRRPLESFLISEQTS